MGGREPEQGEVSSSPQLDVTFLLGVRCATSAAQQHREGGKMRFSRVAPLFILGLALAVTVFAQTAGTTTPLSGTVITEGKPLPGVTVTVSSPSLQGTRTAVTGEAGGYNFPSLPPGEYTATFELAGMGTTRKHVTVNVSSTSRADVVMKVSGVSEAITVTAAAPAAVETTQVTANFKIEQI